MTADPTTPAPRDWAEDATHENGNYQNRCGTCGELFIGHKRRVQCRACAGTTTPTPMSAEDLERIRSSVLDDYEPFVHPLATARGDIRALLRTLDAKDAEINRLQARLAEAEKALGFYANPEVYRPHPDGLGFDDRDLSYVARAFHGARPASTTPPRSTAARRQTGSDDDERRTKPCPPRNPRDG